MKFNFGFGKRFGFDRLTDEQKAVFEQLERGEISEAEAERLLRAGADVRVFEWQLGGDESGDNELSGDREQRRMTPEDAKAREMIDRIACEVDAKTGG